jgi:uncharacterized membrane protein
MKILLFNDNPVVRKLVALSAQKTKDDLSVVWSADEIEEGEYDLLIMDDALYSDEVFDALQEKTAVKSKLYMATRGNSIPEGFDNVINKPFLPTDLVDMFVKIENKVGGSSSFSEEKAQAAEVPVYSINLEDTLPELEEGKGMNSSEEEFDHDEFDFGGLDDLDENLSEAGILDKEEVQEVQGLLEDTDEEEQDGTDEILVQGINEVDLDDVPKEAIGTELNFEDEVVPEDIKEEFSFDDEIIPDEMKGELLNFDDILEGEALKLDDEFPEEEKDVEEEMLPLEDFDSAVDFEDALEDELPSEVSELSALEGTEWSEKSVDDLDLLMDDSALENLGSTIDDAMSDLEEGDLERELSSEDFGFELDESMLDELNTDTQSNDTTTLESSDELDEFDMLDEKELKRAIGEEVEEEEESDFTDFEPASSFAEEMSVEASDDLIEMEDTTDDLGSLENGASSSKEGVEALQALLKALSNEEVAKSLKGLNISININFGNEK